MARADLRRIFREAARIMGPAFLVSVAYMDPGNWATAIEAGSRFGYQLVWVVVLSNLIAILLQTLAARLGLVTGKHLAQVCREAYPPVVCYLLWALAEISIVALDLTMVLGTAIGLNLLLGWPMLPCILLTGLDALLLLLLVPRQGVRTSEQLTVGLLVMVVGCFLVDLGLSKPPLRAVLGGLVPRLSRDSVYAAVCLLGANVMPHNFLLHSALVAGQARGAASTSLHQLCLYNFLDIAAALGLALLVNVAVLLVAAATFHQAGIVVETLQDAHDLMEKILSSRSAPAAFGLALLCAGQLSTFTGTIAGQFVLRGFLNVHCSTWLRRVATRSAAVLPAALLQYAWGDKATYKYLLVAQVVLALQLPFTLVPLIKATSSTHLMGPHRNSTLIAAAAWGSLGLVFVANLMLFVAELWPGAAFVPQVVPGAPDSPLHQYLDNLAGLAWARPAHFLLVLGLIVAAAGMLALQLWIIVTPLSSHVTAMPLLLRQAASQSQQQQQPPGSWEEGSAAAAAAADGHWGDAASIKARASKAAAAAAWESGRKATAAAAVAAGAAPAAAAAGGWPGLMGAGAGRIGRPVVVGWNVPGVREWLLGAQQAAAAAAGTAEEAALLLAPGPASRGAAGDTVGWSHDIQLAVHSRLAAPGQHGLVEQLFSPQLRLGDAQAEEHQPLLLPAPAGKQPSTQPSAAAQGSSIAEPAEGLGLADKKPQPLSEQQLLPDSWDDVDVDSISLLAPTATTSLAPPSSPTGCSGSCSEGSSGRPSFSALGADREVWLDTWHEPSCIRRAGSSSSSISLASTEAAAAAASHTASRTASTQAQQQRLGGQLYSSRAGAADAASRSPLHSTADRSAAAGALSKSGRRLVAAVLEGFWAAYYDTHGNCTAAAAAAATRGSRPSSSQQQPHKKQALASGLGSGQAAGSTRQQTAAQASCCCRCGAAGASSGWCCGCGVALLAHMQGCLAELLAVPGAAELVMPSALAPAHPHLQPQAGTVVSSGAGRSDSSSQVQLTAGAQGSGTASGSMPAAAAAGAAAGWSSGSEAAVSAASLLVEDVCAQLPGPARQVLQLVLPAAADGTLLHACSALSSSVQQAQQQQQQQQDGHCQVKREEPSSSTGSLESAAAVPAVPAVSAVLWCWGLWCMLLMLVLAQVEVRPELWGRYAAVLNRLQGLLADIAVPLHAAHQQQQQHQHQHHKQRLPPAASIPSSPSGRTSPAAAVAAAAAAAAGPSSGMDLASALCSPAEHERLLGLLLGLLQQVEAAVAGRKAPGGGGGVAAAFAKGKEICLSVVKRYRRRMLGSTSRSSQQQRWPAGGGGGGGGSSGKHRQWPPSGSGGGGGQRVAFGLVLGGMLVAMPLMLAAGCGACGMATSGCTAVGVVWQQQHFQGAVVVLQQS